ncbi:MAG: hypothetical protein ACLFWL_12105 [Candidatus Brocadiia bacterium]
MVSPARPAIEVSYADPRPRGLPVSIGIPFPQGEVKNPSALAVAEPGGEIRPTGARPLAHWPDGSVRWCLLSFGARQIGRHQVSTDKTPPQPECPVTMGIQNGGHVISNRLLTVHLSETGPGPISHIDFGDHVLLDDPAALRLCVDQASTAHEKKRAIEVIEHTPVRCRVRLEGAHYTPNQERHLSYRLDIEMWAGWPNLRLDYHFFNRKSGTRSVPVNRIALETTWQFNEQPRRHFLQTNYGLFYVSRHVVNPDPVELTADFERGRTHVTDPGMLLDDVDYPFYLHPPLVDTNDWLGVHDGQKGIYMQVQDMTQAKPNKLCSKDNSLVFEPWSADAGTLDLPQGRSRRHVCSLAFLSAEDNESWDSEPDGPQNVADSLTALLYRARASVAPRWLVHCGEFDQGKVLPFGKHVRVEQTLHGMMNLDMPDTKFDVGDTKSHYTGGYVAMNPDKVPHLEGAPEMPRIWPDGRPTQTYIDCHEPVWTNNEYDAIHAFCNELMRTGRHDLWPTIRLLARHNIEVDFVHYSDHRWIHRATPAHSARHTTTGAYPSHFWTQGLLEYYCMTGDPDALEVALALGDKTIENFEEPEVREKLWGFNREVGWALLLLVHLYDITREERFRPLMDEMVDYLAGFDRDAFTGAVNLSSGNDLQTLNRQIVGSLFGYVSMIEALDHYVTVTGRKDVEKWLENFMHDLADEALKAAREGSPPNTRFCMVLSVGWERTRDERFLKLMGLWLDNLYWNSPGPKGSGKIKPVASFYRGFTRAMGHAYRAGLLAEYEYPAMKELDREG